MMSVRKIVSNATAAISARVNPTDYDRGYAAASRRFKVGYDAEVVEKFHKVGRDVDDAQPDVEDVEAFNAGFMARVEAEKANPKPVSEGMRQMGKMLIQMLDDAIEVAHSSQERRGYAAADACFEEGKSADAVRNTMPETDTHLGFVAGWNRRVDEEESPAPVAEVG